jgi:hypothetical protein
VCMYVCVRLCSVDVVMPLVPADDARLVRHIRKQKQRMERRKHMPAVKKTHEGFDMLFGTDDKSVREVVCICAPSCLSDVCVCVCVCVRVPTSGVWWPTRW